MTLHRNFGLGSEYTTRPAGEHIERTPPVESWPRSALTGLGIAVFLAAILFILSFGTPDTRTSNYPPQGATNIGDRQ